MTATLTEDQLIELKLRYNFSYYAEKALQIITKEGKQEPFSLNKAQRYIHRRLEKQLKETGKVRALIVKGRQQGVSTYTEGRFIWKTSNNFGIRAFILTHHADATKSLFDMSKRFYYNLPDVIRPENKTDNAGELFFAENDSGFKVSTAGSRGVGRGMTITHMHGSEVAYWQNEDAHIVGLMQAIPDADGTEVILESTAAGPTGMFYRMSMDALAGKTDYQVIFVPWFWQDEYRKKLPRGFEMTPEEEAYARSYNLDPEQIAWRRERINLMTNGVSDFRREYPATIHEAFTAEVKGSLWKREDIESISEAEYDRLRQEHGELATVVAYDPAGAEARESSDESGIVVATLLNNDTVYVLEDASGKHTPAQAVDRVIDLYHKYGAARIVAEVNGVGSWVPSTIALVDRNIPVYGIYASKSKQARAEPVAQAYRQGRVVHVRKKDLSVLESEQTTWNPRGKNRSPNRLDAAVYAISDLIDLTVKEDNFLPVMSSFLG